MEKWGESGHLDLLHPHRPTPVNFIWSLCSQFVNDVRLRNGIGSKRKNEKGRVNADTVSYFNKSNKSNDKEKKMNKLLLKMA